MKTLWLAVSVLALANLLAVGGFIGWLKASDRLDTDRLRRIREMLSVTVADERSAADAATQKAEADAKTAADAARLTVPPETAAEKIAAAGDADDAQLQTVIRRRRELDDVLAAIARERSELDAKAAAVKAERDAFNAERKKVEQAASDAQFRKALATLEAQKPADARAVLEAMMTSGGTEQVIAYISAMEERVRAKVLAEFTQSDSAVAAGLLEQLRTHGVKTPVASAK